MVATDLQKQFPCIQFVGEVQAVQLGIQRWTIGSLNT